jgi:two-component system LytT family response regulator
LGASPANDDGSFPLISEGWREEEPEPARGASPFTARSWAVAALVWTALGVTAALQQAGTFQMRGMDGFGVLAAIEMAVRPVIVFVTAFDEYAIRAFDVHAVDYLLKPFDADRFRLALDRVRERVASPGGSTDTRLDALLSEMGGRARYADRLLLKDDGNVIVVLVADIDWIESADNYVKVHARGARYRVRQTIKTLEAQLDPAQFARAHRSAIVNLERVRSLAPMAAGEYVITLSTGEKVDLSRGYRDSFRERLEGRGRARPES